jgi:hypothetical protein
VCPLSKSLLGAPTGNFQYLPKFESFPGHSIFRQEQACKFVCLMFDMSLSPCLSCLSVLGFETDDQSGDICEAVIGLKYATESETHERKVGAREAQDFAEKHKLDHLETSAKSGENITEAFTRLAFTLTFLQIGLAKPPRVLKYSQKFDKFILNSGSAVQNSLKNEIPICRKVRVQLQKESVQDRFRIQRLFQRQHRFMLIHNI